jgi:hypothetical protein
MLVEHVELKQAAAPLTGPTWHGANYLCPHCKTILSSSLDPLSLKNDIVDAIVKKLRGGK